ncbi:hypothetical protein TRFO_21887 [Tritrichomonas foetus]|uniref:Uncharacterized protein n=1 Tax=Tritrichomonas foetus TaxID=1144522 RepID=A0A1J4KIV1_9EUKA|nr:hypothetical protein TRFO_21887 [Tritrichomonas foetus]|eukprot:OHT09245.1 hypothetical protein TRFO_21887 [Tritrichomonas foetus]
MHEYTYSPRNVLCNPTKLNSKNFINEVNEVISDLDFLTDDPPPNVPESLIYKSPIFKMKELASDIGDILEHIKFSNRADNIKDGEIIASFINSNFDFSTDYQLGIHEMHSKLRTVFDILSKYVDNSTDNSDISDGKIFFRYPSKLYLANEILFTVSVLSAKSSNVDVKRQITQCFLALGSNTLKQVLSLIICPLCVIAASSAGAHCSPSQFEIDGKTYFNFDGGFDVPLSHVVTKLNCVCNYKSTGGCNHFILFSSAYAIHSIHKNDQNNESEVRNESEGSELTDKSIETIFPFEIAGKGAHPPNCIKCNQRPGVIAFEQPGESKTFQFFCKKCFADDKLEREGSRFIDLTENFFSPNV